MSGGTFLIPQRLHLQRLRHTPTARSRPCRSSLPSHPAFIRSRIRTLASSHSLCWRHYERSPLIAASAPGLDASAVIVEGHSMTISPSRGPSSRCTFLKCWRALWERVYVFLHHVHLHLTRSGRCFQ
ncbi:hypothetical protein DENSPDRAFT_527221 [Dentipellis sp. KUC8613]|nr:hypothetical protein DENSPDRAFT_527221 [Dentipellis sp. KUC8613]